MVVDALPMSHTLILKLGVQVLDLITFLKCMPKILSFCPPMLSVK